MAGETQITVVGNLTDDPELRFTPTGAAVANFTVASTPRMFDKQHQRVEGRRRAVHALLVWRQYAENVAESLSKGMRVIVDGRLKQRSYETREGEKRTVFEIEVDEVGPALRTRPPRSPRSPAAAAADGGFGGGGSGGQRPAVRAVPAAPGGSGARRLGTGPLGAAPVPPATSLRSDPPGQPDLTTPSTTHPGTAPGSREEAPRWPSLHPVRRSRQEEGLRSSARTASSGIDYKDTALLRKFISDRGKIRARRVTGNCTQHQRDIAMAVKNAREMALLPYTSTAR